MRGGGGGLGISGFISFACLQPWFRAACCSHEDLSCLVQAGSPPTPHLVLGRKEGSRAGGAWVVLALGAALAVKAAESRDRQFPSQP